MIQKINIELVKHPFTHFKIQSMPLFLQHKPCKIDTNEHAVVFHKEENKQKKRGFYQVKPLQNATGTVYVSQVLNEPVQLEVNNQTMVTGKLLIENMQLKALSIKGFKEITIYNANIGTLRCEDKNKVKVLGKSNIKRIYE